MKRSQTLSWALYRFFAALVKILPLSVSRLLMARVFRIVGPFLVRANGRMDRTLKVVFPFQDALWHRERRHQAWINLGKTVAESIKTRAVQGQLDTHVTYRLEPELSAMQQDPRGQLLLMGHLGAWEVAIQIVPRLGKPVMGVYRPLANPRIEEELQRSRRAAGIDMVSIDDPTLVRRAIRHLKSGGLLAIFVDQRWGRGALVDLFETPALTTLSPGLFQFASNARVSTMICRRESATRFEAVLESLPYRVQEGEDWRERGRSIMRAFHSRLEDWVRVHPDDWYWLQERWKP